MATTYALVLRPPRAKDGLRPVHLRLTSDRAPKYRAVPNLAVATKDWNEAGTLSRANWVRKSHPYADDYNETLRKLLREVEALLKERPNLAATQLHTALAGDDESGDFLAYMRQDAKRRAAGGHPRTAEKFLSIHNKLQSFRLGIPHPTGRYGLARESDELKAQRAAVKLSFGELTVRLIRDYEQYLLAQGNRDTTNQKELSFIKTVVLRAVDEDLLEKSPFTRIRLREGKARVKAKLTDEEVSRLEALTPEQLTKGQLRARDTWLLQYYLLGSRIGDALSLRWRDVRAEEVEFTEHKTGKQKLTPRHEGLNAVLSRYQERASNPANFVIPYLNASAGYAKFPAGLSWDELSRLPAYRPHWIALITRIESATVSINSNLKQVAELAGITKHLTTHVARHSFADRGRRLGLPAADMRDMLNHHSIAQTETYYGELERSEIKEKARSIYQQPVKHE